MKQFEYMHIHEWTHMAPEAVSDAASREGIDGWELVSVVYGVNEFTTTLYFKREVQ